MKRISSLPEIKKGMRVRIVRQNHPTLEGVVKRVLRRQFEVTVTRDDASVNPTMPWWWRPAPPPSKRKSSGLPRSSTVTFSDHGIGLNYTVFVF